MDCKSRDGHWVSIIKRMEIVTASLPCLKITVTVRFFQTFLSSQLRNPSYRRDVHPNPQHFLPLVQSIYSRPHFIIYWICNTGILPLSLPRLPGARTCSKSCGQVCKRAAPRPIWGSSPAAAALFRSPKKNQWWPYLYLLDFPFDVVFDGPTHSGLCGLALRIN